MSDQPQKQLDKGFSLTQSERAAEHGAAPPTNAPVDKNAWKCQACGRYHGAIQVRVACLEKHLAQARAENVELRRRLDLERTL